MRNSSSLDWLRFMHTPNDYRVSPENGISLKINSFRYGNDPKILPLTITRQYAAFISFSCLYYFFNCLRSFRLTVVERTLDIC